MVGDLQVSLVMPGPLRVGVSSPVGSDDSGTFDRARLAPPTSRFVAPAPVLPDLPLPVTLHLSPPPGSIYKSRLLCFCSLWAQASPVSSQRDCRLYKGSSRVRFWPPFGVPTPVSTVMGR